jgi:hypothetical protein
MISSSGSDIFCLSPTISDVKDFQLTSQIIQLGFQYGDRGLIHAAELAAVFSSADTRDFLYDTLSLMFRQLQVPVLEIRKARYSL